MTLWKRGKVRDAINAYFHMEPEYITPAMRYGLDFHEGVEKHILEHGCLPDTLPNFPLVNPTPELYFKVEYNELFDISCKFDLLDKVDDYYMLYEWKTGTTHSAEWADSGQVPLYFLIGELAGLRIKGAYIARYNQHVQTNQHDFTIVWNNSTMIAEARNIVDSIGPEIYEFFSKEGLI